MIPEYIIQKFFDKANSSGTDIMRWSDFFECMEELRHTDTTDYTQQPFHYSDLPEYADDTAALADGLNGGDFYRTSTGVVHQVLPET